MRIFFNMDSDYIFIETRTAIVWQDNLGQGKKEYVYGLKFIEMSSGDIKKLKMLLTSFAGTMQDQKWLGPFQAMRNKRAPY